MQRGRPCIFETPATMYSTLVDIVDQPTTESAAQSRRRYVEVRTRLTLDVIHKQVNERLHDVFVDNQREGKCHSRMCTITVNHLERTLMRLRTIRRMLL